MLSSKQSMTEKATWVALLLLAACAAGEVPKRQQPTLNTGMIESSRGNDCVGLSRVCSPDRRRLVHHSAARRIIGRSGKSKANKSSGTTKRRHAGSSGMFNSNANKILTPKWTPRSYTGALKLRTASPLPLTNLTEGIIMDAIMKVLRKYNKGDYETPHKLPHFSISEISRLGSKIAKKLLSRASVTEGDIFRESMTGELREHSLRKTPHETTKDRFEISRQFAMLCVQLHDSKRAHEGTVKERTAAGYRVDIRRENNRPGSAVDLQKWGASPTESGGSRVKDRKAVTVKEYTFRNGQKLRLHLGEMGDKVIVVKMNNEDCLRRGIVDGSQVLSVNTFECGDPGFTRRSVVQEIRALKAAQSPIKISFKCPLTDGSAVDSKPLRRTGFDFQMFGASPTKSGGLRDSGRRPKRRTE